jgi:hypothetical protein
MKALSRLISFSVVAALAGVAFYFWKQPGSALKLISPAPAQSSVSSVSKPLEPEMRYPVPGAGGRWPKGALMTDAEGKIMPGVDESDPTIQEAMARIFGPGMALFYPKDIVRRIVVSIDSLTGRKQSSARFLAVQSPDGTFQAAKTAGGQFLIGPANSGRYSRYVSLLRAVDVKKAVAAYVRFYPLFQSAYGDLGTQGYFNDRLVQVVDEMLATPDIVTSPDLISSVVAYRYADPKLEALSSGQRLLMRMGSDNEKAVKSKLRQLRALLTSFPNSDS